MISAILLAAGRSLRYPDNKLLEQLGNKRLMDWAVESLTDSSAEELIVVCNPEVAGLFSERSVGRGKVVLNPEPQKGMASSILCGLEACSRASEAVLIAHADMPKITSGLVDRLIVRWKTMPNHIVAPRFNGRQGNPVLLPRAFWNEIRGLQGDVGCKSILQRNSSHILWVECEDDAILFDVDTEHDLAKFRNWILNISSSKTKVHPG